VIYRSVHWIGWQIGADEPQAQFEAAVDTQVLAKPQAAADGMEKLVKKRESRLNQLQDEVERIRRSI
jgi:hypothetical protein